MEPNETNQTENKPANKNTSIIGLVIVIGVLILGGILLSRNPESDMMDQDENTVSLTQEETQIIEEVNGEQAPLTESTDVNTLEQELSATNLDQVLTDLESLDQELAR